MLGQVLRAIGYCFEGASILVRTQRSVKLQLVFFAAGIVIAAFLGLSRLEWLLLLFAYALVITTEGLNTAIEFAVDLASPGIHPLAKAAKDTAAGAVLFSVIGAIIVVSFILMPRLGWIPY